MNYHFQKRLWIFDFDGTLSTLVPVRDRAKLHPVLLIVLAELTAMPLQRVAILSSRILNDLIKRVPVGGLYLGGSSGIEWRFPEGDRFACEDRQRLVETRKTIIPALHRIASLPGIELEDKEWSIALHTRRADPDHKDELLSRIENWNDRGRVTIFSGPEVLEVQLIPGVDKAYGVRSLCRMLDFDPVENQTIYAGDDTNDACAMGWIERNGGITITVGESPLIPGSTVVQDQIALADKVREIAGLPPGRREK